MPLVPLVTAVVAAVFAALVLSRWHRGRYAVLMWGVGLAMFAVAAFAGFLHRAGVGTDLPYRAFYLFGAILNVAWLGLGTIYLLAPRRVATASLVAVATLSVVSALAVFASPVDPVAASDTGRGFESSPLPRVLAGIGSGLGSIVMIGGALWSAWRFSRTRLGGQRAVANVLIAVGVFVVAAGGTAAFTGARGVLEWTNLGGLVLMFVGFLLA